MHMNVFVIFCVEKTECDVITHQQTVNLSQNGTLYHNRLSVINVLRVQHGDFHLKHRRDDAVRSVQNHLVFNGSVFTLKRVHIHQDISTMRVFLICNLVYHVEKQTQSLSADREMRTVKGFLLLGKLFIYERIFLPL